MSRDNTQVERTDSGKAARTPKTLALIYAPPVFGWLLVGLLGVGGWAMWGHGDTARPLFAMGALAATTGLSFFVAHLARARGAAIRWLATCTAAVTGVWVIAAVLVGPATRPVPDLYLGGGAVTCIFWMARRALLSAKGEQGHVPGQVGKLLDALDGARVAKVSTQETRNGVPIVKARVEVDRGRQTVDDLQRATANMETVLGLRPNSVKVVGDKNDAGYAEAMLAPVDPLSVPATWAPDRPGASIADPIRYGPYLDGADCEITLPGDEATHRNLAHILAMGMTGAGKSASWVGFMVKVACRREVTIVGSDPVKGLQTLGLFARADALELLALDIPSSRALLGGVKRAIKDRGHYLGARGYKQWASGCGLTFLVVWLEEANWTTQSGTLEQLAAEARSVGIQLVVSQQRASHTKTNTDLRANLPAGVCFGVKDAVDAGMCLPDEVIDAGAHPEAWGSNRPGYCYVVHPSVPEDRWPIELRAEIGNDEQFLAELQEWAHVRAPMDEVTRAAFGKAYDQIKLAMTKQRIRMDPAADSHPGTDLVPDGEPAEVVDEEDLDGFDEEDLDSDADDGQSDDDGMPPVGSPVEPGIDVDPDADIAAPPPDIANIPLGPLRSRRLSTDQARAVVQAHLQTLAKTGATHCKAADVAAMHPPTGRSREWVRQELHRLCTAAGPDEIGLEQDMDADQPGLFLLRVPAMAGAGA